MLELFLVFLGVLFLFGHFGWMLLFNVAFHPINTLITVLVILFIYHFACAAVKKWSQSPPSGR